MSSSVKQYIHNFCLLTALNWCNWRMKKMSQFLYSHCHCNICTLNTWLGIMWGSIPASMSVTRTHPPSTEHGRRFRASIGSENSTGLRCRKKNTRSFRTLSVLGLPFATHAYSVTLLHSLCGRRLMPFMQNSTFLVTEFLTMLLILCSVIMG